MIFIFITGYHGTTLENAYNIIDSGQFIISNSNTEWLGSGIYFYYDLSDAYDWKATEAILHCVIKIDEDSFMDLDDERSKKLINDMINYIYESEDLCAEFSAKYIQKNQCALMKMIWDSYPKLKTIAATFKKNERKIKFLIDPRSGRKEFCVRNNESIKLIQLIRKDDLDD